MFTVSLRVLSSVYTQDDKLNAFLYRYSLGQETPEFTEVRVLLCSPMRQLH